VNIFIFIGERYLRRGHTPIMFKMSEFRYHPAKDVVFYHADCGRLVFQLFEGDGDARCSVRVEDPDSDAVREIISLPLLPDSRFERVYGTKPRCLVETLASLRGVRLPKDVPSSLRRGIGLVLEKAATVPGAIMVPEGTQLRDVDEYVGVVESPFTELESLEFLAGPDDLISDQYDRRQREEDRLNFIEHLNSGNN